MLCAIRKACDLKKWYVFSCSIIAILLFIDSSNLSRLLYVSSGSSKCFRSLNVGLGLVCCEVGEKTKVAPKLLLSALCGEVYSILNKVSKLKLNTVIKVLKRHPPIFIAVQFPKHLHRDVSVKQFRHRFIKKLVEVLDRQVTFAMAAHQFPQIIYCLFTFFQLLHVYSHKICESNPRHLELAIYFSHLDIVFCWFKTR